MIYTFVEHFLKHVLLCFFLPPQAAIDFHSSAVSNVSIINCSCMIREIITSLNSSNLMCISSKNFAPIIIIIVEFDLLFAILAIRLPWKHWSSPAPARKKVFIPILGCGWLLTKTGYTLEDFRFSRSSKSKSLQFSLIGRLILFSYDKYFRRRCKYQTCLMFTTSDHFEPLDREQKYNQTDRTHLRIIWTNH